MKWLARLLDLLYAALLLAVTPLLAWRSLRTGRYRRGWREKLWGSLTPRKSTGPCVWFHAVSVGEVVLLEPVIRLLETTCPAVEVVVSTTTDTGMDVASAKYAPRRVFYCPLDFSWACRRAVRRIQPDLLVLAELELWPNLILAAREAGAGVGVINGRLSARSFRGYRKLGPLIRGLLAQLQLIAVQNDEYARRFEALGATPAQLRLTGSVKFDGAQTDRLNPRTRALRALAALSPQDIVFLAGSTQAPEERLALEAFERLADRFPRLKLVLVPRHPERFREVAALLDARGCDWVARSRLPAVAGSVPRVILVDAMGELGAWWGTAQIAFVGGSLGSRGGQNMIEPAAYGAAVSFGPQTRNFRQVVDLLLASDAATVVPDGAALSAFVERCLEQPAWARAQGARARQVVLAQQGAVGRTVDALRELLAAPHLKTRAA